jgi:multidrug transporter EmrE-like cation transporter
MTPVILALIVLSVALSAGAQILLKIGMSSAPVLSALDGPPSFTATVTALATAPQILLGGLSFGLSFLVWLFVLARMDVSHAYPCTALGIVMTVIAGHLALAEPIPFSRIAGMILILVGVSTVALGR